MRLGGGERPGDPPSLGGGPVGGGQRAKVFALRQHWMEKILAPKMGQSAGRPNSAPAATQTKAVGLVPGVVTAGVWVRGCPPSGENQVGPGTRGHHALAVTFRKKRGNRVTTC